MGKLKIEGVTHWSIPVNNLDESEKFYGDLLGLKHLGRLGSSKMSCFNVGDHNILLCQRSGNVEMTKHNLSLLEALGSVGGLSDQRANKTGVYVFRMGDLDSNPAARARVFRLDLFQPVSIFVAQQFGLQPRDVIYVTNAPLYEYDKILTSIYRTFSIVGIARGNLPLTTTF